MKDIEWLKEVTLKAKVDLLAKKNFGGYDHGYMDALTFFEDAMDDVGQVEQPALPEIPDYVAVYLEYAKSDTTLMRVMELANTGRNRAKWDKEYDWIEEHYEQFARAWLDGYTVEEKKYYVIKDNTLILERWDEPVPCAHPITELDETDQFTEQEIKDYDERYWSFAKEVTE